MIQEEKNNLQKFMYGVQPFKYKEKQYKLLHECIIMSQIEKNGITHTNKLQESDYYWEGSKI